MLIKIAQGIWSIAFTGIQPSTVLEFYFSSFLGHFWFRWSDVKKQHTFTVPISVWRSEWWFHRLQSTDKLYMNHKGNVWVCMCVCVCLCIHVSVCVNARACVCDIKDTQISNLAIKRDWGERTSSSSVSSLSPTQQHPCSAVMAAEHQLVAFYYSHCY